MALQAIKMAEKPDKKAPSRRKKAKKHTSPVMTLIGIAIFVGMLTLVVLFGVETVESNAMQPTLSKGDLVVFQRFTNLEHAQTPRPGNVYALKTEADAAGPNFLRVIACDEGNVSFYNDKLTISGQAVPRLRLTNPAIARPADEPEIWRESLPDATWHIMLPQTPIVTRLTGEFPLKPGTCFLAGDNRMGSLDSRQNGPMPVTQLRGKALFILKSVHDDGLIGPFIKFL